MSRRKNDSLFDDLFAIFMRVPPWICIPVAGLLFVFINGMFLWVAKSSPITKSFADFVPFVGGFVAAIALLAGGGAAIVRMKRRQLYDGQTSINSIRALSWVQFEQLIGEAFRRLGYEVQENQAGGADGGVDLRLRRDGEETLVQCKQWNVFKVGVGTVRELYGVVIAEKAARGILVTSGIFTNEAKKWAEGKPLELIDGRELRGLIGHLKGMKSQPLMTSQSSEAAKLCPICEKAMILRTARRGSNAGSRFWGCSGYPGCRGTRVHQN